MYRAFIQISDLVEIEDYILESDTFFIDVRFPPVTAQSYDNALVVSNFTPANIPIPIADITGTGGNDVITNTETVLEILGLGGRDTITNTVTGVVTGNIDSGDDSDVINNDGVVTGGIFGRAGVDIITNNGSVRAIHAGASNDTVFLLDGSVVTRVIDGSTGDDALSFLGRSSGVTFAVGDLNDLNFETYIGTAFDDVLSNNRVVDNIDGGEGSDTIQNEGTVSDFIFGREGSDTITNIGTSRFLFGGYGEDIISNTGVVSRIYGDDGEEFGIFGRPSNDIITNSGNVQGGIYGEDGADIITNSGTVGSLEGGSEGAEFDDPFLFYDFGPFYDGDDTIINEQSGTVLTDIVASTGDDFVRNAGLVMDDVFGNDGNDVITNARSGTIQGNIEGGAGDDIIVNAGTVGGDINASDGNDVVQLLTRSDVAGQIDGGLGTDTLSFAGRSEGIIFSATDSTNISDFENFMGSDHNDTITGGNGDNVIVGGAGDDTLRGNVDGVVSEDVITVVGEVEEVTVNGVSGTNVPLIKFTVAVDGLVTIDILAFDLDPDGDGLISKLFSDITVYTFNSARLNGLGVFQGRNDGAAPGTGGDDGSARSTDSFLSLNLVAGEYVLAVADFLTTQPEFRDGFSPGNRLFQGGDGDFQATISGASFVEGGVVQAVDSDMLIGGDGDDTLFGLNGDDSLYGDAGEDELYGGNGADVLRGGTETDLLYGDAGDDFLGGDEGDDFLLGGDGNDRLSGGDGQDRLFGQSGEDLLVGGDGDDRLQGGEDNDILRGGTGNDRLLGQSGNDSLSGEFGNDLLRGGDGADLLQGGDGNDILSGDAGNDRLFGGEGDDILSGGEGSDVLTGGSGADSFDYKLGSGIDAITDFTSGIDIIIVDEAFGLSDFDDLQILQRGNNTLIRLEPGGEDALILLNTIATSLTADDFEFEDAATAIIIVEDYIA